MVGVSCLYRRPSGIYVVRLAVPARLRQLVGRGEIHASTGLRELNAAKLAALQIQFRWRERFMTFDVEKLVMASPLLHGEGLIPIREGAKAIGLSDGGLLNELLNERAELFTHAQSWPGWMVSDIYTIERDFDGTFVLNDVEAQGVQQSFSGAVRAFDSAATIAALMSVGITNASIFRLSGDGAFWTANDMDIPLSAWMVSKAAIESVRARLVKGIPLEQQKPATGPSNAVSGGVAAQVHVASKHARKKFSELFELLRNHRAWGKVQSTRMTTEAGLFIELMNDPLLEAIDLETIHSFAGLLSRLPNDIYQSRRRFKVESLSDLMGIAEKESLPMKAKKTVKGHVGRVGEILNFAVEKGMIVANPASGFKREWGVSKNVRAQDERDEFSPDELSLIFSDETRMPGSRHWRPHYFWLPLLALTTGGRLNELSQLYLDDVRQAEQDASIWYLDFNTDQSDKIDADDDDVQSDKSLKSVNSKRVVPLHQVIIQAGFPEYVAALRKANEVRLFPELKRDDAKGYAKPAGSWFNERFLGKRLGIKRNGRKSFHSFRHNFGTAIERLSLPERVTAQLLGHERGQTQSGTRYSKDRNAFELRPVIDRLVFPCLANVSRFDLAAAKEALKAAKRLKAAMLQRGVKV